MIRALGTLVGKISKVFCASHKSLYSVTHKGCSQRAAPVCTSWRTGIDSICIQSHFRDLKFMFLCSLQQCRAGSRFGFPLLVMSLLAWFGSPTKLVGQNGCECCSGIVPDHIFPQTMSGKTVFCQMSEACSKMRATFKNKRCYQSMFITNNGSGLPGTWFRSWLLLAVSDNCSHQTEKSTEHLFITAKTSDPAGHSANISMLLKEDLAPVASTLSAKLSQTRRICHQHNQKHGEREGWD